MQRRGFLKAIAALLPAAAATKIVSEQAEAKAPEATPVPKEVKHATITTPSLRAERQLNIVDIDFFCDVPASRGTVVEIADFVPDAFGGSGGQYAVVRPGFHSGQPMGVLLDDVCQVDFSKQTLNDYLSQVAVGGRVHVCRDGWIIVGQFDEPVQVNQQLYYDQHGKMTTKDTGRPIGIALSGNDADGYIKMKVMLYVNQNAELPRPH